MSKTTFNFLLYFLFPIISLAQSEPVRNFSVKDGLPSGVVYDCLQDKQGFMWFATAAGLARFDGTNFKVFTTENGLTNNEVLQIALDKDGSIWIFPFAATPCLYDPASQKLYNEKNYAELKKLKNLSMSLTVRNSKDRIIGFSMGRAFFFENKKIIIRESNTAQDIWVLNQDSVINFSTKKCFLSAGGNNFDLNFSMTGLNMHFPKAPDWGTWKIITYGPVTTKLDLYKYTHEGLIVRKSGFVSLHPINSVNKYDQKIYIATVNGVFITDTLLTQLEFFFPGKNISKSYLDDKGNEWLCSLSGEGVYMRLKNGVKQYDITSGLPGDNISSLKIDQNKLLLCGDSKGNVFTIDTAKQSLKISLLKKLPEAVRGIELYDNSFIAYSNYKMVVNNKDAPERFGAIKAVIPDPEKNLLIGSHSYLIHYNLISNKCDTIDFRQRIVTLCYFEGELHFGNDKGLFKVESLKPFKYKPVIPTAEMLKRQVNYIASKKDGILWIATNNDGVVAVKNAKVMGHFSFSSQFPLTSNICKKLFIEKEDQVVWVATNKGINRIKYTFSGDSLEASVTAITSSEGLNDDDVNDIYVEGGRVYAATIKGICTFSTDLSRKEIPVVITDIIIKNYSPADTLVSPQSYYKLNYWQNNISISYAGICFTCSKQLNYQYRLLGNTTDTSWKSTTANTVEFVELLSGNYTFQMRTDAANMKEVNFYIKPAFWQTKLFYGLIVLTIGALFFFSVKFFTRQIRKRELEKTAVNKKFAELEFQALQAQMNPHFVFNAMNTLQNYILKNESENASEYLARFSRLMRLFLDASRNKFITLDTEIELLQNYIELEQARVQNGFQYKIIVEHGVEMDTRIPSVIIQPFVENAILHGLRHRNDSKGLLQLYFSMKDHLLECRILDNGIGRQKAGLINKSMDKQYQSQGIRIVDEKVRTLKEINNINIHISVQDNTSEGMQAEGTTVTILFG